MRAFLPLRIQHLLDLQHRDIVPLEKSGQVRLVEQFHRIERRVLLSLALRP